MADATRKRDNVPTRWPPLHCLTDTSIEVPRTPATMYYDITGHVRVARLMRFSNVLSVYTGPVHGSMHGAPVPRQ